MQKNESEKYFAFANDTYLVNGYKRHCIYDLAKGNLYSVSDKVREILEKAVTTAHAALKFDVEEKSIIENLRNLGILVPSASLQEKNDISTLKQTIRPNLAWIEVTKGCNLKCYFCYIDSSTSNCRRMSIADFTHVINELKTIDIKQIQLIGGEPLLLGNDLKEMISLCCGDFSYIEVFTNATLLNEEWCQFFKDNNIRIALSVHSYIPSEHDKVTKVKGSHNTVLKNIRLLQTYGIPHRIAATRTRNCKMGRNLKDVKYNVSENNVRLSGRAHISQYNLKMFKNKAITIEKMKYPLSRQEVVTSVSGIKCFLDKIYINTNLDVFPCVMERRFIHGNFKNNRLQNILRENISTLSKDHINVCKDCEYRYACFDCRPDSNGADKYAKPWYCTYDPYTGKWQDVKKMYELLIASSINNNE